MFSLYFEMEIRLQQLVPVSNSFSFHFSPSAFEMENLIINILISPVSFLPQIHIFFLMESISRFDG